MGTMMLNSRPVSVPVKLNYPFAWPIGNPTLPPRGRARACPRPTPRAQYAVHAFRIDGQMTFESRSKPLLPRATYFARLARSAAIGLLVIAIALGAGMLGYHHYEGMPWIDAFANAAMILSGMGPLAPLNSDGGKLFAGFYALFSGLAFVVVMGIVFAPVVHRFMHRFHLEENRKDR